MIDRRRFFTGLAGLSAASLAGPWIGTARAATTLKIGTLAPASSIWGLMLKSWADNLPRQTGGMVQATVYYNGAQGDEGAMISKLKSGQLHGALVTSVGLSKVYKPVLSLQIPGLFSSWAKLDAARAALRPEFEKGVTDAGFTLGGWLDVGTTRLYSKDAAIRLPEDFRGKKPFQWRDQDLHAALYQLIGSITPVPLNIPEVLPNLNTGAINVVDAPPLLAESLMWTGKLNTVHASIHHFAVGGMVFKTSALDPIASDMRTVLLDLTKTAAASLTTRVRTEDDAAYNRHASKMTVVTHSAEEVARWEDTCAQLRQRLGQGTFASDLISRLEGYR